MKELTQKNEKENELRNYKKINKYFLNTLADALHINTLDLTNEMDKGDVNESTDKKIQ